MLERSVFSVAQNKTWLALALLEFTEVLVVMSQNGVGLSHEYELGYAQTI